MKAYTIFKTARAFEDPWDRLLAAVLLQAYADADTEFVAAWLPEFMPTAEPATPGSVRTIPPSSYQDDGLFKRKESRSKAPNG